MICNYCYLEGLKKCAKAEDKILTIKPGDGNDIGYTYVWIHKSDEKLASNSPRWIFADPGSECSCKKD